MNCVFPPELDDGQLLAYLDGEADHQIATHVAQCPYCREKASQLSHWHNQLAAKLFRVSCPSSIELGDYQFGLVSTTQAVAIARHVSECPHCRRELAQLRDYLRGELALPFEAGPMERIKVLVARLVTGPDRASTLAGIRGEATGPITWEADGVLIVLDIQPAADGRAKILGQVAADDQDDWTGAQVELRQAGELQATATVDDLGAFRCEAVSPGPAEILISPSRGSPVLVSNVEIID
jgi:hypothetical protein